MEWEFSEDSSGDGRFKMSGRAMGNLRNRLGKGDIDGALSIYEESAGDLGRELVGEFATSSRQLQKYIANLFFRSGEFMRAAACAEVLSEWLGAARAYESAGHLEDAARCFARAGEDERAEAAANAAMKAPRRPDKADVFHEAEAKELAGKLVEAADLYKKSGHKDRAASVLERIPKVGKDAVGAAIVATDILVERGQIDSAIEQLRESMPPDRVIRNATQAEIAYRLGVLLQQKGQRAPADAVFELIIAFDPNYRDVANRIMDTAALARARAKQPEPEKRGKQPEARPVIKRREIQEKKPDAPRQRPGALSPQVVGIVRGAPAPDEPPPARVDPVAAALADERRDLEVREIRTSRDDDEEDDAPPKAALKWFVPPLAAPSLPPVDPSEPPPEMSMPRSLGLAQEREPEASTQAQFDESESEQHTPPPDRNLPAEIEASIAAIRGAEDRRPEVTESHERPEFDDGTETMRGDEGYSAQAASSPQFRGRDIDLTSSPTVSSEPPPRHPVESTQVQARVPEDDIVAAVQAVALEARRQVGLEPEAPEAPARERQSARAREEPRREQEARPAREAVREDPSEPRSRGERDEVRHERDAYRQEEPRDRRPRQDHYQRGYEPSIESRRRDPEPPAPPNLIQARRRRRMMDPFAALNRELGQAVDPAMALGVDPSALDAVARISAFGELARVEIAELLEMADEVEYRPGAIIASRGHVASGLIVILEGRVSPTDAGPCVNPMSLFDEVPSQERVLAVDTVRAFHLPRSRFLEFLVQQPRRALPMYVALTKNLLREKYPPFLG